jgi:hypothetical protein
MTEAADGDYSSSREFFETLLATQIIVLGRTPEANEQVRYPNELLDVLALPSTDSDGPPCVPCFLSQGEHEEWAIMPTPIRTMQFSHLLTIIPENWEVSLNPGSETGKDFSLWELARLRFGAEGITEILADLNQEAEIEPAQVQSISDTDEEYQGLLGAIRSLQKLSALQGMFLFKRRLEAGDEELIVGAWLVNDAEKASTQAAIQAELDNHTIGLEKISYWLGSEAEQSPEMTLLRLLNPVWSRHI